MNNYKTINQVLAEGNSSDNQRIKGQFIETHVNVNVGQMVEFILSSQDYCHKPFDFDDIKNMYILKEWSDTLQGETITFNGGSQEDKCNFLEEFERLEGATEDLFNEKGISEETHDRNMSIIDASRDDFLESTEDEEAQDVMEWWSCSSYLIGKLSEMNEPVITEENIWGRCTSGQAILLDYCITKVCADMGILHGQENSWAK